MVYAKETENEDDKKDIHFIGVNIIGEIEENKLIKRNEKRLKFNINTKKNLRRSKKFLKKRDLF